MRNSSGREERNNASAHRMHTTSSTVARLRNRHGNCSFAATLASGPPISCKSIHGNAVVDIHSASAANPKASVPALDSVRS